MSTRTVLKMISLGLISAIALAEPAPESLQSNQPQVIKPYRTFLTIQRYNLEASGTTSNGIFNTRLEIQFIDGSKTQLPENGHHWPIGQGQSQEINRTFEIPWSMIQSDGTRIRVQMIRSGVKLAPCEFAIDQISQFNRAYTRHTDIAAQSEMKIAPEKVVRESVQIRVFSDRNANPSDIPKDVIALK